MKKLILLIVTSFVAIGTSAVGIQGEDTTETRNVVIIVESATSDDIASKQSVARWR